MANPPKQADYAYPNGGVNPNNADPAGIPNKQQAAIAPVVAQDIADGATVHAFDPNAKPEEKAAAARKGGFNKVFGAPKALGKGVANVGSGVTKGVTGAVQSGAGAVSNVGGGVVRGVGNGVGAVAGGVGAGVGAVTGGVGAVAGGARNMVGSMPGMGSLKDNGKNSARAVAIDTSTSGNAPKPTATLEDAAKATDAVKAPSEDDIPGTIPKTVLPGVPDWMPMGWKENAGIAGAGVRDAKTAEELSILSTFLKDQYYGQWYHNAAIIVGAVLATRLVSSLGLGWGWVFIILAFCSTAYSLSIERTRRRARDDIQRELVKTRLVTETESADWLNGFLDRFWLMYEPVLSATIVSSVDAALVSATPAFLESIRLTTFTLGNKAPRIDYVRTFPKTPDDEVVMDWALSFTPNDMQDVTPRMAVNRVNPKVVLTIRLGKGFVSTGMPILVEDINFSGKMRIKLKLMPTMPHVQKVEMSFLEKPFFDFVLKPIGGETLGFDINNIPGLEPFIHSQVHGALGPMMYDPNVFTLDLEQLLSGEPLDAAIGVLKITVLDAHGLKSVKIGGGLPDPYVSLSLGAKPPVARTKTVMSSANPTYGETHFILVNSLSDVLNFNVLDWNEHRADDVIGTVSQELSRFADDAEEEGVVGKILGGGKERGEIRYDMYYYPTIQPEKKPDGTFEPLPDIATGIVRLQIHQAKDLDAPKDTNAIAKVYLGSSKEPCHVTDVVKKSNSPSWESHVEFIVADKHASVVTVYVQDKARSLGRVTVRLTDILAAKEKGDDWFPLQGTRGAKIRLNATFKPVSMPGALDSAASYSPPIGILRVWIKNAQDVKNVEGIGKSDPYVRVQINNRTLARTEVQNNNLNPVWDQIVYVPVHNLKERVVFDIMDYENVGKDRSIGTVSLDVAECALLVEGNTEFPYGSKGHQVRSDKIRLDKGTFKGVLNYEVDFKPAMSLRGGVSFDAPKNDVAVAAQKEAAAQANGARATGANGTTPPAGTPPAGAAPVAPAPTAANPAPAPTATAESASIASAAVAKEDPNAADKPPVVPAKDTASAKDAVASKDGATTPPTETENPETGVVMTDEQLLQTQSGVLVFQVIEGQLARKGALEVLFDDGYWPVYTSERARSTHARWDQVGEGFVRELEFGRTWLRINAADESDEELIVAECKMDTHEFLEASLNKVTTFTLTSPDGVSRSTVKMSSRFVPIDIKLEPRETINNQGILRVTAVSGKGLKAVDRGGKSDPNITFLLNGMKVFKSETKKKTVNPVWNETFDVAVPSRVAAKFKYEVADWNTVGSAEELGEGWIDLTTLEPFQLQNLDLPVVLNGKQHGTVQVNLLFQPEIIARSRQKTSTFSAAGRTVTNIGGAALGAPVAVGKGVIQGGGAVVHGVGNVITAPTRLFRKKDRSSSQSGNIPSPAVETGAGYTVPVINVNDRASLPPGASISGPPELVEELAPVGGMVDTALPEGAGIAPTEPGTLTVTVIGVRDLKPNAESHSAKDLKPYIVVKLNGKSHKTDHGKGIEYEWNENFSFNVSPGTSQFTLTAYDKHSFGKDIELGEVQVDIWRHIQPAIPTADVAAALSDGSGIVKLRLDWALGAQPQKGGLVRTRSRTPSVSSRSIVGGNDGTPRSKLGMTPNK